MNAKERKEHPVYSGVLRYFPDALLAVAHCSWKGNEQHNPGEPLYWNRSKSTDEADALMRHLLQAGEIDADGVRHTAKVAWRALALLQKELEKEKAPSPAEKEPVQLKLPFDDVFTLPDVEAPQRHQKEWFYGMREAYAPRAGSPTAPGLLAGTSAPGSGLHPDPRFALPQERLRQRLDAADTLLSAPIQRHGEARPQSIQGHRYEHPSTSPRRVVEDGDLYSAD